MRFWESSAVVPLVVQEPTSGALTKLYAADPTQVVGCITEVEVWSAVCRKRRENVLNSSQLREARDRLSRLAADWTEVDEVSAV